MQKDMEKLVLVLVVIFLFINTSIAPLVAVKNQGELVLPLVTINLVPYSIVYEGDIINCTITGDPTNKYWCINNQFPHVTFYGNNPLIFDPEPTPLGTNYVNLTVYAENTFGHASDTVQVMIKRIYFGDIHWHSTLCDGDFPLDTMYQNAIKDNYLDFVCYTGHAEWIDNIMSWDFKNPDRDLGKMLYNLIYLKWFSQNYITYEILKINEWEFIKKKAVEYYSEGNFTTFLGFEWSGGSHPNSFHNNFYYKDIYPDAAVYSSENGDINYQATIDDIYKVMTDEWNKGHYNVGFPHHPQYRFAKINWTYFANNVNASVRNQILRGVEMYSWHGTAIGQNFTPGLPYNWPYTFLSSTDGYLNQSWVENGIWEWSESNTTKGQRFVMMASSDTHSQKRPGSAKPEGILQKNYYNPAGIVAAYAVHNNRSELWDAMNSCDLYASQLLKIRAAVRFDGEMVYGRWITCRLPLNITITAHSTYPGFDRSGKRMCPPLYSPFELDYPIQDIWILKNDREKGKPWCKIINHTSPNTDTAVVCFQDYDVHPNDFYWVALRQKGEYLRPRIIKNPLIPNPDGGAIRDEYMAYIGPVFISNVV